MLPKEDEVVAGAAPSPPDEAKEACLTMHLIFASQWLDLAVKKN